MLNKFSKRWVRFDAFPKIEKGYQQSTSTGGLLTILVLSCMFYLAITELTEYLTVDLKYEFLVDTTGSKQKLQINADILVAMECHCKFTHQIK